MTNPVRGHLSSQVVGANLTWYERSIRRREEEKRDEEKESSEAVPTEIDVSIGVQEAHSDKPPAISVRQRVKVIRGKFDATYEVTVSFRFKKDFPVSDDILVRDFVRLVGFDYVLGFVRGALADDARSLGLSAPLIPAFEPNIDFDASFSDDEVEGDAVR